MARTMTVDVGDELRKFIDSLIKAGDYRTESEVVRDALRLLCEGQTESRLQELRNLLAEGISSGEAKLISRARPSRLMSSVQTLEPAMLTAINLDEFSGAGPTRTWLMYTQRP